MSLLSRAQSLLAARVGATAALAIIPLANVTTAFAEVQNSPVVFNTSSGGGSSWYLTNNFGAFSLGENTSQTNPLGYQSSDNVTGIAGSGSATVFNQNSGGGTADLVFDFYGNGGFNNGKFTTDTIPGHLFFTYTGSPSLPTSPIHLSADVANLSYDYQVDINSGGSFTSSTGNAILDGVNDVSFDINVPNGSTLDSWDASVTFHLFLNAGDQATIDLSPLQTFDINPTVPIGGGSVPEPATLGLLATAGLGLLARRRA